MEDGDGRAPSPIRLCQSQERWWLWSWQISWILVPRTICVSGRHSSCSELPAYIPLVIHEITNEQWKKSLVIFILERHNHEMAEQQNKKQAVLHRVALMDANGMTGAPDGPTQPFPQDFFDTTRLIAPARKTKW
jgi:hypothetical protein